MRRDAVRRAQAGLGRAWRRLQPVALSVAGVGLLAASVWVWAGLAAGLAASGAAALLLEWRVKH